LCITCISHHVQRGPGIPCCAGARNICIRFADVTCTSGVNPRSIWHICHANVTRNICVRCASCTCSPRTSCKCCAHLLREERATRDVTFGPLCKRIPRGIHSRIRILTICVYFTCPRIYSQVHVQGSWLKDFAIEVSGLHKATVRPTAPVSQVNTITNNLHSITENKAHCCRDMSPWMMPYFPQCTPVFTWRCPTIRFKLSTVILFARNTCNGIDQE
jgi:hypothetical protein